MTSAGPVSAREGADQGEEGMSDLGIIDVRAARRSHKALGGFMKVTAVADKPPSGNFKTRDAAEAHVYNRQRGRNTGKGMLDVAVLHWRKGVAGGDEHLARLLADRASLGTGETPRLIGDIRVHVDDTRSVLNSSIQSVRPGVGRLAVVAGTLGVLTLGASLLWAART